MNKNEQVVKLKTRRGRPWQASELVAAQEENKQLKAKLPRMAKLLPSKLRSLFPKKNSHCNEERLQ
jgi:hypothetical protein